MRCATANNINSHKDDHEESSMNWTTIAAIGFVVNFITFQYFSSMYTYNIVYGRQINHILSRNCSCNNDKLNSIISSLFDYIRTKKDIPLLHFALRHQWLWATKYNWNILCNYVQHVRIMLSQNINGNINITLKLYTLLYKLIQMRLHEWNR